jgi:hypothetical protein
MTLNGRPRLLAGRMDSCPSILTTIATITVTVMPAILTITVTPGMLIRLCSLRFLAGL